MKVFFWILFMLSLFLSPIIIDYLAYGIENIGWEWIFVIIPFSLSIAGFFYLLKGRLFEKTNQKQKIILGIFIPIIFLFFTLKIAVILGYRNNPFNWGSTWHVWMIYAIFCGIFEYNLFADKRDK